MSFVSFVSERASPMACLDMNQVHHLDWALRRCLDLALSPPASGSLAGTCYIDLPQLQRRPCSKKSTLDWAQDRYLASHLYETKSGLQGNLQPPVAWDCRCLAPMRTPAASAGTRSTPLPVRLKRALVQRPLWTPLSVGIGARMRETCDPTENGGTRVRVGCAVAGRNSEVGLWCQSKKGAAAPGAYA